MNTLFIGYLVTVILSVSSCVMATLRDEGEIILGEFALILLVSTIPVLNLLTTINYFMSLNISQIVLFRKK